MKVLVTGGSGRIGRFVVADLVKAGVDVIVMDRLPPEPGVRWMRGDVEDFGDVVAAVDGVEAIVHLAAIPAPWGDPDHVVFRNNVTGTYHVHQAAMLRGVRRVVSTSSTAVYGWAYRDREFLPDYLPLDEAHPCRPQDPYGLAKLCVEQTAAAFTARCGIETVVLRPGRVFLPEDAAVLAQAGGIELTRFDLGQYTHVHDLASAYRQALESGLTGHEVFNVVADDSTSPGPLSEALPQFLGEAAVLASKLTGMQSAVSNEKAKRLLGWQPQHSWRQPATTS